MAAKAHRTGFMAFSAATRADAKAALVAAGLGASVTDVSKALGERWRCMPKEEKKAFNDRVAASKADAAAASKADAAAAGEEDAALAGEAGGRVSRSPVEACPPHVEASSLLRASEEPAGPVSLPLARVKRLIRLDPDVKQTQADAAKLIGRATELFVELLAGGALGELKRSKRKTLQRGDLTAFAGRRQRFKFLQDHLAETAKEARVVKAHEAKGALKETEERVGGGLHAFFATAAAGDAAPAEEPAAEAHAHEEEEEEEEE